MQTDDQIMAFEKAFWDLIAEGLQKFESVNVSYASYIVLSDLNNMLKRNSTDLQSKKFSKNCESIQSEQMEY